MSYLTNLERDYVMGDLQVYREFDSSHFISNAKSAITNKVEAVNMNMKFDYYTSMLEKAIKSFSNVTMDHGMIRNFLSQFNKISKLDTVNIYTRDIGYSDVTSFKPQYLVQYTDMVQGLIDNVVKGLATSDEITKFMTGVLPEKVERQVVKTTLKYGITPKELIKEQNVKTVKADSLFVKTKLLPFLDKYGAIKLEVLAEARSVSNSIRETENNIKAMLGAVERIKASGNLDFNKVQQLNQVSYNTIRGIIDVVSYVTFMMIRKLNNISSDIMACNKVYIDVCNLNADNVNENAFDHIVLPTDTSSLSEGLTSGKADAYISLSNQIYNFHAGTPSAKNIDDVQLTSDSGVPNNVSVELDQEEYDQTIYNDIGKAYISISAGLDILATDGDEYLLLFDDLLEKSGFSILLEERFQNELKAISDVSVYKSSVDISQSNGIDYNIYRRMLRELKEYGENMQTLANIIYETYKKILLLSNRFANNINGEYHDTETINELKVFLKSFKEQFINMTEKVAQGFFDRMKSIGNLLTIMETSSDRNDDVIEPSETSSSVDMSESAFESVLQDFEEETKMYFNALEASYYAEKELALRGVKVIFEADDAGTNNPTGNANNTQNNNQTDKNDSKVSVVDNNNDTASNASSNTPTSKISEFIKNTLAKFIEFINKSSTKNSKWLQENKEELTNRSYNNVTVNILPYNNIQPDQIITDIGKLSSAVKSMTQQNIQAIQNKDALYQKLFSFISSGIKENGGSLTEQFTKYYKVGKAELTTAPVSNGALKAEITGVMIPFCENYTSQYKDKLEKALSDLGSAVDSTISGYSNDNNGANNGPSIKEKAGWMSEAVKYFSGSILNALRDRNSDYLKVLSSLAPKTPAKPVQPKQQNNNQEQQQNNNQQQASN